MVFERPRRKLSWLDLVTFGLLGMILGLQVVLLWKVLEVIYGV